MADLVGLPVSFLAIRPVRCVGCRSKTSLIVFPAGRALVGQSGSQPKCLPCRFRAGLEAVRDGRTWDSRIFGLFDTGPALLSRKAAWVTTRQGIDRNGLHSLLRQHAGGDFGAIGRFQVSQDTKEVRDLGPLAGRSPRNVIAIVDRKRDVLSIYPVGQGDSLSFWTRLGSNPATIIFTAGDDIDVY